MSDLVVLGALGAACAAWGCVIALAKPRLVLYLLFALVPTQFLFVPVSNFFLSPADLLVVASILSLLVRLAALKRGSWSAVRRHRYLLLMVGAYLAGFVALGVFSRTLIRLPLAMVVSVIACEQLRTRRHLMRAATALVAAGALDAAYGLYYIARGTPLHPTRFQGMSAVNYAAMLIMTAAAIALAQLAWVRRPFRLFRPGALAAVALATLSQMGVLAFLGAWITVLRRVVSRLNRARIAAAVVAILVVAVAASPVRERVLNRLERQVEADGVARSSADIRWMLLQASWDAFRESPVFGLGYFGFAEYSNRNPEIRRSTAGAGYPTHNSYVEVIVEGGAIAFMLFLAHWAQYLRQWPRAVRRAAHQRDPALAAALVGFPVVMVSAAFANVLMVYSFWAVCGLAMACFNVVASEPGSELCRGSSDRAT